MRQASGHFSNYPDTRAIMDKLQILDKGADDIMFKHPIKNWLAKTDRRSINCMTDGHTYSGHRDVEGMFLITHIKLFHRSRPQLQNVEALAETRTSG